MKEIENRYERKGLQDRVREILTLSLFIVVLAFASVLLVDLIVYPFSTFAINNVDLFNKLFKISFLIFFSAFLIMFAKKKISHAKKVYDTKKEVYSYLMRRPLHYIALFCIITIIMALIGSLIYLLFSENYHFLYELTGGK